MDRTRTVYVAPNNLATVQIAPNAKDVKAGLERFRLAMVGQYRTPTGPVVVSTPFGMNDSSGVPAYRDQLRIFKSVPLRRRLVDIAKSLGYFPQALARVNAMRGTPTEIHQLAQGLVNNPPPNIEFENDAAKIWTPRDVRRLMYLYSLCIDCAGYVQQAYLFAWRRTRGQANFRDVLHENLSGLSGRGYRTISAVADVAPGDIVVLEDTSPAQRNQPQPVGHRTIVYDQRLATDDDLVPLANDPGVQSFTLGGPIRALEMDSSWGSGGFYGAGGVQRRLFLFNESTQNWASTKWDEYVGWDVRISPLLYDHRLDGFYRRHGD